MQRVLVVPWSMAAIKEDVIAVGLHALPASNLFLLSGTAAAPGVPGGKRSQALGLRTQEMRNVAAQQHQTDIQGHRLSTCASITSDQGSNEPLYGRRNAASRKAPGPISSAWHPAVAARIAPAEPARAELQWSHAVAGL